MLFNQKENIGRSLLSADELVLHLLIGVWVGQSMLHKSSQSIYYTIFKMLLQQLYMTHLNVASLLPILEFPSGSIKYVSIDLPISTSKISSLCSHHNLDKDFNSNLLQTHCIAGSKQHIMLVFGDILLVHTLLNRTQSVHTCFLRENDPFRADPRLCQYIHTEQHL